MIRVIASFVLVPWVGLLAAADDRDASIQAALKALDAGQAVAALQVLNGHPSAGVPGKVRLIQARALLALGRHQEAAVSLKVGGAEQLQTWPENLQATASAVAGEIALASGDFTVARQHLERALRLRGEGVAVDRTMVLLAECGERQGDTAMALRYAHAVWRDWSRSPHRGRAGVIEARLIAKEQPDQARSVLAGVRVLDQIEPSTRLSAAELLCHLLLPTRPGQCLVVAEQEQARLTNHGRLPIYRALALAALDPHEGLVALLALPELLRHETAVGTAITRLQAMPTAQAQDAALRIERARAEIELGRTPAAREMLEPLAATQPAALILLSSIDGVALERWLEVPAMSEPSVRAAVGIALARRADHVRAWALLQPLSIPVAQKVEGITAASLLYWATVSAQQVAPERASSLAAALLALDDRTLETGLAWANEAQRREQSAASPEATRVAWERAALALPSGHPWQPIAILRAASPLITADGGLEAARQLLERVDSSANQDQLRCRFVLAQVYERLGLSAQAVQVVDELQGKADAEQLQKLTRMRARLSSPAKSEVQEHPLDAEN